MEVTEITIGGEVYTVTKYDDGHVVKELKMTPAQMAIINAPRPVVDPLAEVKAKLNTLITELAEVKADVKAIKNKP